MCIMEKKKNQKKKKNIQQEVPNETEKCIA